MKMRGRTISIYIPDSDPKSIKICEISNSIVKSISIPRTKLSETVKREELQGPGIYFLVGEKNDIGKIQVYIGEAENLFSRIKQHNISKDFWNYVICFISEKKNINKAHIKYLENFAYSEARRLKKCELHNSQFPTQSSLTEQDEDFCLGFFDDIKLLVSTLGLPIFEESKKDTKNIFYCKGRDADAIGEYSEDGFTVFEFSKSNLKESKTAGASILQKRQKMLKSGILEEKEGMFVFTEDYTFDSPSGAASIVLARRANGWTEWKDEDGITLDEKIRKSL